MQTPPYRADHVGSLLRPDEVKKARKGFYTDKNVPEEELRAAEDKAIRDLIKMQEDVGLKAVTDGEQRRSFWHYDFMDGLTGLDLVRGEAEKGADFAGVKLPPLFPTVSQPLDFPDDHPMLEHFTFVKDNTKVTPKISIPGPSACHFRVESENIHVDEYKDVEAYTAAIAKAYKKAVQAFYDVGCRYLQMDDIFFAYLCDPKHRGHWSDAGQDPDWLINRYAWMMEQAIADRPDDMVIGMHMCRGNFKSTHAAEGAYDLAADAIFNQTSVDIYFMEYDTERAGDLQPLSQLPKGKKRVLPGFITTKKGELEGKDFLRKKFDEVGKYADLDQFGIAPQCGFSSTEDGNDISFDEQSRKLELCVETAEAIWGEV